MPKRSPNLESTRTTVLLDDFESTRKPRGRLVKSRGQPGSLQHRLNPIEALGTKYKSLSPIPQELLKMPVVPTLVSRGMLLEPNLGPRELQTGSRCRGPIGTAPMDLTRPFRPSAHPLSGHPTWQRWETRGIITIPSEVHETRPKCARKTVHSGEWCLGCISLIVFLCRKWIPEISGNLGFPKEKLMKGAGVFSTFEIWWGGASCKSTSSVLMAPLPTFDWHSF